ncbi:MAG: hypothetical protein AABW58_04565 [Nanoarchaeota archaeon]
MEEKTNENTFSRDGIAYCFRWTTNKHIEMIDFIPELERKEAKEIRSILMKPFKGFSVEYSFGEQGEICYSEIIDYDLNSNSFSIVLEEVNKDFETKRVHGMNAPKILSRKEQILSIKGLSEREKGLLKLLFEALEKSSEIKI